MANRRKVPIQLITLYQPVNASEGRRAGCLLSEQTAHSCIGAVIPRRMPVLLPSQNDQLKTMPKLPSLYQIEARSPEPNQRLTPSQTRVGASPRCDWYPVSALAPSGLGYRSLSESPLPVGASLP
eukprot:1855795-Rhodomonas_salina.1